jgi:regulator of protease activity HflC (stomatin/prohibitin superfamily)
VVREVLSKHNVAEIAGEQRESVVGDIKARLTDVLASILHIEVSAVQINSLDFSPQYKDAINQATLARTKNLAAQQEADRAKIEAQTRVTQAQAEADAQAARANGQARAQIAQAQAEADGNLARARAEAEGNLVKARADAEALRLRGEADAAATRARIEAAGAPTTMSARSTPSRNSAGTARCRSSCSAATAPGRMRRPCRSSYRCSPRRGCASPGGAVSFHGESGGVSPPPSGRDARPSVSRVARDSPPSRRVKLAYRRRPIRRRRNE